MREICKSGSMSGEWKRGKVKTVGHRQTKGSATVMLHLNYRATPRLYSCLAGKTIILPEQ